MRLITLAALTAACAAAPDRRAIEVTRRALVVDAHSDITEQIVESSYDFSKRHSPAESMEDLPRLREGGLDAQFFAIWINHDRVPPDQFFTAAEHELIAAREALEKIPGMALATTARQVRENKAHGVVSALFGVEGGYMLTPGDEVEHLRRLASLGARYLTLTHTKRGSIGGSSGDLSDGEGLTDQGRVLLDELWRLGVVVDVSHVSDPLFWDVVRVAKKPVLASHSSSRALANVPRNLTDAMLRAIAKTGGAACVNFYVAFLDAGTSNAINAAEDRLKARGIDVAKLSITEDRKLISEELRGFPLPDVAVVANHVQHMVKVAGIDHVCLGSDFDGIPLAPRGLEDASKLPALTQELLKRGMSEPDIAKILGGNLLRVLEANEAQR
ncbi:MAG TPA: membrane dipeptidase [Myxococcales bacterium]|nr:membrane dipeptidase [Myxococcales bacterium]